MLLPGKNFFARMIKLQTYNEKLVHQTYNRPIKQTLQ